MAIWSVAAGDESFLPERKKNDGWDGGNRWLDRPQHLLGMDHISLPDIWLTDQRLSIWTEPLRTLKDWYHCHVCLVNRTPGSPVNRWMHLKERKWKEPRKFKRDIHVIKRSISNDCLHSFYWPCLPDDTESLGHGALHWLFMLATASQGQGAENEARTEVPKIEIAQMD